MGASEYHPREIFPNQETKFLVSANSRYNKGSEEEAD